MQNFLTAVTGHVSDLPHVAADVASTWDQHIHRFVTQAKLSKPVQHEVAQNDYDRLLRETAHHPRFEGTSQDQRKAWLDARLTVA
jgi:hypothetical protein